LILEWLRAGRRWDRALSTLSAAAIGLLIGLAPLLAYNWMTSGNPFRPTQAMEVERFFQSSAPAPTAPAPQPDKTRIGYPPPGWHGGTIEAVQGGGLRLSNLRTTLPGNVAILRGAYGNVMLAIAIWGAVVALVRRRTLFVLAVSYVLIGLVFFSFWSRPDNRYLSGVFCMLPLLIVEGTLGTLDVVRLLARRRLAARGTGLAPGASPASRRRSSPSRSRGSGRGARTRTSTFAAAFNGRRCCARGPRSRASSSRAPWSSPPRTSGGRRRTSSTTAGSPGRCTSPTSRAGASG